MPPKSLHGGLSKVAVVTEVITTKKHNLNVLTERTTVNLTHISSSVFPQNTHFYR